jgi:hypothetical protein
MEITMTMMQRRAECAVVPFENDRRDGSKEHQGQMPEGVEMEKIERNGFK